MGWNPFAPKYADGTTPTTTSSSREQQYTDAQQRVTAARAREDQAVADYSNIPRKDRSHRTPEAAQASQRMLQASNERKQAETDEQQARPRSRWF